jgi:aminobenzoyl-glutamate transport protein
MKKAEKSLFERIASKIPDPIVLFLMMYVVLFVVTVFAGGMSFSFPGVDSASGERIEVVRHIRNMAEVANVQWIFDNAIIANWLAFAHGLVGILVVAMLGLGVAEGSGMFSVFLKLAGRRVNRKLLPYVTVFAGILSNIAADAG